LTHSITKVNAICKVVSIQILMKRHVVRMKFIIM